MQMLVLFADLSLKVLQEKYYKTQNNKSIYPASQHHLVILFFKRLNLFNQCTVDTLLLII